MTATIGLAELAAGGGALALAADGSPEQPVLVVDLDGADWSLAVRAAAALAQARTPVLLGVAREPLPAGAATLLERLSCTLAPAGPGPFVATTDDVDADLARVLTTVRRAPVAAVTLAGLLRVTATADVADGLLAESLAYSALLAGAEFATWRSTTARKDVPTPTTPPVRVDRQGDRLLVTLDRPERHNAFGRATRDALLAALDVALADPDLAVELRAEGPSFCSGGDLDEFGTAADVAVAHLVRLVQSAGWALHRLRDRLQVEVHGACIGAGLELPAFAGTVLAREGTWFRLPELGMGLVPGAGGTVSVTRRIGRWRTAYLALTDAPLDLDRALDWGLVDGRA